MEMSIHLMTGDILDYENVDRFRIEEGGFLRVKCTDGLTLFISMTNVLYIEYHVEESDS